MIRDELDKLIGTLGENVYRGQLQDAVENGKTILAEFDAIKIELENCKKELRDIKERTRKHLKDEKPPQSKDDNSKSNTVIAWDEFDSYLAYFDFNDGVFYEHDTDTELKHIICWYCLPQEYF